MKPNNDLTFVFLGKDGSTKQVSIQELEKLLEAQPAMRNTEKRGGMDSARMSAQASDDHKTHLKLAQEVYGQRPEHPPVAIPDLTREAMEMALGPNRQVFAYGSTIRRCLDCSVPVQGGPTRCASCANGSSGIGQGVTETPLRFKGKTYDSVSGHAQALAKPLQAKADFDLREKVVDACRIVVAFSDVRKVAPANQEHIAVGNIAKALGDLSVVGDEMQDRAFVVQPEEPEFWEGMAALARRMTRRMECRYGPLVDGVEKLVKRMPHGAVTRARDNAKAMEARFTAIARETSGASSSYPISADDSSLSASLLSILAPYCKEVGHIETTPAETLNRLLRELDERRMMHGTVVELLERTRGALSSGPLRHAVQRCAQALHDFGKK